MRRSGGVMIASAVVASATCGFLPAARAGGAGASIPSRRVIAFNCESCPSLPTSTIRWNSGILQLRGDAGPDVRWSPTGSLLAYADGEIWLGTLDLSVERRLTKPTRYNGAPPEDAEPAWFPSGKRPRIAYLDGGQTLTVLDLRTNQIHKLGVGTPSSAPDGYVGDSYFSWSPDGRYLVGSTESDYVCNDPTGPCQTMELWIVNAATGDARLIYQTPDGGSIGGVDWR